MSGEREAAQKELGKLVMCWLDNGGENYMTNRREVAKLSGVPAMAICFREHLEIIEKKLRSDTASKQLEAAEKMAKALDLILVTHELTCEGEDCGMSGIGLGKEALQEYRKGSE